MRPSRAATFAAVYTLLHAAHQAGDYLAQTDPQALRKPCAADRDVQCTETESWGALVGHITSYHLIQAAALLLANRALSLHLTPGRAAAGIAISALTHTLIDRRWPVRLWMDHTGSSGFRSRGGAPQVDQAMHYLALAVATATITGGPR